MSNITGKYLNKIRKDLIEYAECLLEYTHESPSKYKNMLKAIIRIYIEKYYYVNEVDFAILSTYFENIDNMNYELKKILVSIVNYLEDEKEIKKLSKNTQFYLSIALIIWISNELNNKVNPFEEKLDYRELTEKTINTTKRIFPYTKDKSNILIRDRLLEKIKENYKTNKTFFEILSDNKLHNKFKKVKDHPDFYEVEYEYEVENLDEFRKNEVNNLMISKGVKDNYTYISLELLTLTIQKLKMLGKNKMFLYKLPFDYYSKTKNIDSIKKLTNIKEIKESLVFVIDYDEFMNNRNIISEIKIANYTIALDNVPAVAYKNYNIFADSKLVFVTDKLLEINNHFVSIWKEKGIDLIIRQDINEILLENELLK